MCNEAKETKMNNGAIDDIYEGLADLLIERGRVISTHNERTIDENTNKSESLSWFDVEYNEYRYHLFYANGSLCQIRRTEVDII